jgi:hypothetical protein
MLALLALFTIASPANAQSARGWTDRRTEGTFDYHADFPLDSRRTILNELPPLRGQLAESLGITMSGDSIDVYLFANQSTYNWYLQQHFPGVPSRKAMFIKSRNPGNVFAYDSPTLATDLKHECTHALLHASLPFVPLWLDEGLAEYFEVAPERRAYHNPHLTSVKRHVIWRKAPSMEKLEDLDSLKAMGHREYRDAWAWVHFMLHGPTEARDELVRFLTDIQAATPPGRLSERLQRRLPRVERQFAEHFKHWSR